MTGGVSADTLETFFIRRKLIHLRLAGSAQASHSLEIVPSQVLPDTYRPSSVPVSPTGGVTPPGILLDFGLSRSVVAQTSSSLTRESASRRSVFDARIVGSASRRSSQISDPLKVSAILLSSQLVLSYQSCHTIKCSDILRFFK